MHETPRRMLTIHKVPKAHGIAVPSAVPTIWPKFDSPPHQAANTQQPTLSGNPQNSYLLLLDTYSRASANTHCHGVGICR